jgi:hypothetical protein
MSATWLEVTGRVTTGSDYLPAPILNTFVLQTEQVPSVAGRPFFMVIGLAFLISRWVLHFMQ